MKFVISNYSSSSQTEAIYLNTGLSLLDGCESILWNPTEISLYDILDHTGADILICHGSGIPMDLLHYSKQNKRPNLIVNITGINKEDLNRLENYLIENNINVLFFFTNCCEKILAKKTKIVNIPFGADVFLNTNSSIDYKINDCYIVNSLNEIEKHDAETYHYLSFQQSLEKDVDAVISIMQMGELYKNYNNIVFKYFNKIIPQAFFDSVYYGSNTLYKLKDSDSQQSAEQSIKKMLKLDELNIEKMQDVIRSKHTCLNRLKTLVSQLPCQDSINNIDILINSYKERFSK